MAHDSDGRLDLDDLGEVIDAASSIDAAARAEVLDDGRGRTWADRLEDSGVTPWIRRHRVALALGTAVLVVAGVGGSALLRSRPPALDPALRVLVSQVIATKVVDESGAPLDDIVGIVRSENEIYRTAYALIPEAEGDTSTYAVVGLEGPGIRASMARTHPAPTTGQPFANDVDVVLDCSDPSALTPAAGDYRLRVSRTDTFGRIVTGPVDLQGYGSEWSSVVGSTCLQQRASTALTVRSVTATAIPAARAVDLRVGVRNALQVPTTLVNLPTGGHPAVTSTVVEAALPPSSDAEIALRLDVQNCASAQVGSVGISSAEPFNDEIVFGEFVWLDAPSQEPPGRASAILRWSPSDLTRINTALADACAGAPRVTLTVASAGAAEPGTSAPALNTGAVPDAAVLTTFAITTTGSRVQISSPEVPPDEFVGSAFASASAPVGSGRATISTRWFLICNDGYVEPPWLRVLVTTPKGTFPYLTQITSSRLLPRIAERCPAFLANDPASFGWESGAGTRVVLDTVTGDVISGVSP